MCQLIRLWLAVLLAMVISCRSHAMDYMIFPIPDLVAHASVIAEGRIALVKGSPVLEVDRVLKGGPISRLQLVSRRIVFTGPVEFVGGELVVVFLEKPDANGSATLFGYGDQGKWPRSAESSDYPKTYRDLSLENTVSVIEAVLHALSGKDFEEQGRRIVKMLQSKDEVLQLAGLETALSMTLNESLPLALRGPARERLAAFSLPLLASKNGDVRGAAIQLVGAARNIVAAPALIPMLADSVPLNRRFARNALGRVWADGKVVDPVLPEHLATMEGANAAVEAASQKWNAIRAKSQAIELPILRKSLESSSPLESEAAGIYLRYLRLEP